MMRELVSELVQQFSLRTLYLQLIWFSTFGYFMHVVVVMALTRLPFFTLLKAIFRLQIICVLSSFMVAPICAALSITLSNLLSLQYVLWFAGQQVYVWFAVCMMFIASYFLCQVFITVACRRVRFLIIAANMVVAFLGLTVFKSMNLLMMGV